MVFQAPNSASEISLVSLVSALFSLLASEIDLLPNCSVISGIKIVLQCHLIVALISCNDTLKSIQNGTQNRLGTKDTHVCIETTCQGVPF